MATRAPARSSGSAIVLRTQSNTPARRSSGGGKKLEKLEKRLASVSRKAREMSTDAESGLITVGVPAVLGMLQAKGTTLPSFGGFHPMLVWGAPLALLAPRFVGGRWGKRLGAAGVGMLACAGNRAGATGTFKVAGDEIGADDDDEVSGDDDDD